MKGKELKTVREKLNMTQAEFGNLLGYKGYASISEMESGRRKIPKLVAMTVKQMKGK